MTPLKICLPHTLSGLSHPTLVVEDSVALGMKCSNIVNILKIKIDRAG